MRPVSCFVRNCFAQRTNSMNVCKPQSTVAVLAVVLASVDFSGTVNAALVSSGDPQALTSSEARLTTLLPSVLAVATAVGGVALVVRGYDTDSSAVRTAVVAFGTALMVDLRRRGVQPLRDAGFELSRMLGDFRPRIAALCGMVLVQQTDWDVRHVASSWVVMLGLKWAANRYGHGRSRDSNSAGKQRALSAGRPVRWRRPRR